MSDIVRLPGSGPEEKAGQKPEGETGYWSLAWPRLWGDYGALLVGGMWEQRGRLDSETWVLSRVGPFCPSMSLSTELVATSGFAKKLTRRFPRIQLVPVVKGKIVHLRWETWDRTSPQPPLLPCSGEPEDYINLLPHSESASAEMGDLYQVVPPDGGGDYKRVEEGVELDRSCPPEYPFFRVGEGSLACYVVTDEARSWLESEAGGWLGYRVARFRSAQRRGRRRSSR
jgi:hypothetical protein